VTFTQKTARPLARATALVTAGILLAGCSTDSPNTPANTDADAGTPSVAAFSADPMSAWVGDYAFRESCPSGKPAGTWDYAVSIHSDGTDYTANVAVTGPSDNQDVYASVQGDAAKIALIFASDAGATPQTGSWQAGDTLLSLARQGDTLTTTWGSLTPALSKDDAAGRYFVAGTVPAAPGPGLSTCS
jgi:hypothetical protein